MPHKFSTEPQWIQRNQEPSRWWLPRYQKYPAHREWSHQLQDLKPSQHRLLLQSTCHQPDPTLIGLNLQALPTDGRNTIFPASQNHHNQELAIIAYLQELTIVDRMNMAGMLAILSVLSLGICLEIGALTVHFLDPIHMAMNEQK